MKARHICLLFIVISSISLAQNSIRAKDESKDKFKLVDGRVQSMATYDSRSGRYVTLAYIASKKEKGVRLSVNNQLMFFSKPGDESCISIKIGEGKNKKNITFFYKYIEQKKSKRGFIFSFQYIKSK